MQRNYIPILLILVVCLVLASSVPAAASNNYRLDWMVPLSGGGGVASSIGYAINYTIGQSVIGEATSPAYSSGIGYWYGVIRNWVIMLPEIFRNR
jgi:hypothetical protein